MTWLLVSAAQGPVECCHAVSRIAGLLQAEVEAAGLGARVLAERPGPEPDTAHSILLALEGDEESIRALLEAWQGTIQWTCESPFRPRHRRKNWFIGVAALTAPAAHEAGLDERDVRFETMRASGPGGQHVNTTDSAVRAIHQPTGITVTATEERSQHRNRRLALARITAALLHRADAARRAGERTVWIEHQSVERGNPVRVYGGRDFRRLA